MNIKQSAADAAKQEYLDKIYKTELVRDPNTLKYTLGDEKLDALFDLQQVNAAFAPSQESLHTFAAASYLYGLLGYVATNYTAVPGGFLATYKNKNDNATILITDEDGAYWREDLCKLCQKTVAKTNITSAERQFFDGLNSEIAADSITLLQTCFVAGQRIGEDKALIFLKDRIADAIFPFSFSKEPLSLNCKNCNDNHALLDRFCSKELFGKYFSDITPEQQQQAINMRDKILSEWILPGYFTFVGNKKGQTIARDAQVLNDSRRLTELYSSYGVKNPHALVAILNMCTTDYSADVVYNLLECLQKGTPLSAAVYNTEKIAPSTPNNKQQVAARREEFWRQF